MVNLTCPIDNIAPLVPHSGKMILIDRIINFGNDFLQAEAEIYPNHILLQNDVFHTYSAIEIMAQAVAAWAGCMATQSNEPVRLGYLLGTRKLHLHQPEIKIGTKLNIHIQLSIQDATGFGVFDCRLFEYETNNILCEGALNVFSPPTTIGSNDE